MNLAEPETTPGEWESRALCPDDGCIGVLGADGRCGVCGRVGEPGAAGHALHEPAPEASGDSAEPLNATANAADASGDDLGERELCPDDSCIGVLDSQGICKVCGASRPGLASGNDSDN